ncbi:hypothetical protein HYALB_00007485 [Hymenoscyphus albidus]|uniref:RRM domain-containing protein n=1 Tax=Hymenoscyphus albidus TaxID=595503 RepID=A0A9N9LM04_9HELO|nr:hypothetical protein HYALB_00007485 [Hymenoscyphus albidus]
MDSNNWRVPREPSREEDKPSRKDVPSRPSERTREKRSWESFSGWGGVPSNTDGQPQYKYRGGSNPTRGRDRAPFPRPTKHIARDPKAEQAIDEGRRIYVGNLPYDAQIDDLRGLLADITHSIQDISMSVDPMTGRNPSYCFVDFTSKAEAEKTIQHYNGLRFMGRPLKVKPAVNAGEGKGRYHLKKDTLQSRNDPEMEAPSAENDKTPYAFDSSRRLDAEYNPKEPNVSTVGEDRRVFVGGLPRFPDQVTTSLKMKELFEGYNIGAISKLISPHESIKTDPGNSYHCYVDLGSAEEVDKAVAELDGIEKWNWNLRVARSNRVSSELRERQRVYINNLPNALGYDGEVTLEGELRNLLHPFGELEFVSKIFSRYKNERTGLKSGCYCFVEFDKASQTDAASRALDGTLFHGNTLTFRASKKRSALEEHFSRE